MFNCTAARHNGLNYGMQVRADTQACEAFAQVMTSSTQSLGRPKEPPLRKEPIETVGLCSVGKRTLILVVALAIVIDTWLLYTCA
jgi:hypothetical protein